MTTLVQFVQKRFSKVDFTVEQLVLTVFTVFPNGFTESLRLKGHLGVSQGYKGHRCKFLLIPHSITAVFLFIIWHSARCKSSFQFFVVFVTSHPFVLPEHAALRLESCRLIVYRVMNGFE